MTFPEKHGTFVSTRWKVYAWCQSFGLMLRKYWRMTAISGHARRRRVPGISEFRHGEATRRAVSAWGIENVALNPKEYSNSVTAIYTPAGHSADGLRKVILEKFNMPLGSGLGKLQDKVFRIGHLGDFNDLMLAGTLGGVEMGLDLAGVPHRKGGVAAALDYLTESAR